MEMLLSQYSIKTATKAGGGLATVWMPKTLSEQTWVTLPAFLGSGILRPECSRKIYVNIHSEELATLVTKSLSYPSLEQGPC